MIRLLSHSREVWSSLRLRHALSRSSFALVGMLLAFSGHAAETFRKLKDAEIKARLSGMEITDGVHWAEQYMRDGTFKAFHMGKPSKGKWNVRNGQLCHDDDKPDFECKEVWLSGSKVEFRGPASGMAIEGVLQRQQSRN
jgi:hypothetical protein